MRPAAILYNRSNARKECPVTLDETRFSHITVTPDEDDDVVIHAGPRRVDGVGRGRPR